MSSRRQRVRIALYCLGTPHAGLLRLHRNDARLETGEVMSLLTQGSSVVLSSTRTLRWRTRNQTTLSYSPCASSKADRPRSRPRSSRHFSASIATKIPQYSSECVKIVGVAECLLTATANVRAAAMRFLHTSISFLSSRARPKKPRRSSSSRSSQSATRLMMIRLHAVASAMQPSRNRA